jgi:hypothetical protein
VISGTTQQGQNLSTSNGSWSGSPTGYGYQWSRCDANGANCAPISGATGSSYTLVSADVNSALRATVTASNAGGSTSATSNQSAVITAAPASGGRISFVNRSANAGSGPSAVASVSTTINAISGNLLVVLLSAQSNGVMPMVSDSAGNTWHTAVSPYGGSSTNYLALAYAYNISGASSDVVTATYGSAYRYNELVVDQFSGELTSSDPLDGTSATDGYGTAISTPAIAASGDAVVFLSEDYPLATETSDTYTLSTDDTYFTDGYGIATGSQGGSASLSAATNWFVAAVAFK